MHTPGAIRREPSRSTWSAGDGRPQQRLTEAGTGTLGAMTERSSSGNVPAAGVHKNGSQPGAQFQLDRRGGCRRRRCLATTGPVAWRAGIRLVRMRRHRSHHLGGRDACPVRRRSSSADVQQIVAAGGLSAAGLQVEKRQRQQKEARGAPSKPPLRGRGCRLSLTRLQTHTGVPRERT